MIRSVVFLLFCFEFDILQRKVFVGLSEKMIILMEDHLIGLLVKASSSRADDPGFNSRLRCGDLGDWVIPVTSKLALQWLSCQVPGVTALALGLVGPVSVYYDWVK